LAITEGTADYEYGIKACFYEKLVFMKAVVYYPLLLGLSFAFLAFRMEIINMCTGVFMN